MRPHRLFPRLIAPLILGALAAAPAMALGDDAPAEKDASKHFADLLAAARKDPAKADWMALRHAFAETKAYQPYNIDWRKSLTAIMGQLDKGETREAEEALTKLLDREGYMRLDAHSLGVIIARKTGDKSKEDLHKQFIEGISSTLFVPGTGMTHEKPIEVLFIEEEYLFLGALNVKAERQGLELHDGHKFDVYKVEPQNGRPGHNFYFNVDLPQRALRRMLEPADKAKDQKDEKDEKNPQDASDPKDPKPKA